MPKHHKKEFIEEALFMWEANENAPKEDKLIQEDCVAHISSILGQKVSVRTIREWAVGKNCERAKKETIKEQTIIVSPDEWSEESFEKIKKYIENLKVEEDFLKDLSL
jgi:hypothetical protein|tara:strand:+ start:311 stop:634 length:324 start_codon:yes stop_codon:yes gene_type:complete